MFDVYIKRPILSLVISLFITLLGLLALFTLPVTQFPDIVPPSVVVTANYTGANAEVSTNAVAIPLEQHSFKSFLKLELIPILPQ
jgi:HAE1 family hydrophobic/amphiphilic exporter-1